MEDGSPLWGLGLLFIVVLFGGIMYGFHTAVHELNELALEKLSEKDGKRTAKLQRIIKEPYKNTDSVLCIVTLLDIITGILVFPVWKQWILWVFTEVFKLADSIILSSVSSVIALVCLLFIIMVFGVIMPKFYATFNPEKWAYRLLPLVEAVSVIVVPVTVTARFISGVILKIFGHDINKSNDNVTEEEIVSILNEGQEQGIIEASEAEMINNIFEFGDKKADEVMTHRKSIIAVDSKWTLKETVDFILHGTYSRYPVYQDDIDNIIGVLHLKDALRMYENTDARDKCLEDIKEVFLDTLFIPETRNLDVLFKEMRAKKIHMVIVVDEYGQTAGLVAMEDILEEIVGNILDEYDEEDIMIAPQADGTYYINGLAELEEVGEALGIDFGEEYDTLNGFLISQLDRIPKDGERPSIEAKGCRFDILEIKKRIIQIVKVTRLLVEDTDDDLDNKEENE